MDMISLMLGTPRTVEAMNRVVAKSSEQATDLAEKMLRVGVEMKLKGAELGKGQLLDMVG